MMSAFTFDNSPYPIRSELIAAYRDFWQKLAHAGTWWTGEERVAIAAEVRQALVCEFCAERKESLSPYTLPGKHQSVEGTVLNEIAIDAAHRIVTDQTRITKAWVHDNVAEGMSEGHYVELVGVVVCVFSIDEFCRALSLPLEPLPEPVEGDPSQYVPVGLERETGNAAMIDLMKTGPDEQDLWPTGRTGNVVRALSQVPNAVREWMALSDQQYLPIRKIVDPTSETERILSRQQIEIVAGRVSSHNECFY